jgi:hypothetical protein
MIFPELVNLLNLILNAPYQVERKILVHRFGHAGLHGQSFSRAPGRHDNMVDSLRLHCCHGRLGQSTRRSVRSRTTSDRRLAALKLRNLDDSVDLSTLCVRGLPVLSKWPQRDRTCCQLTVESGHAEIWRCGEGAHPKG